MSYDENRMYDRIEHGHLQAEEYYKFVDEFKERATEKGTRKPLVYGEKSFDDLLKDSPELNACLKMLAGGIDPYVVITDLCAITLKRYQTIDEKFNSGEWMINRIQKLNKEQC